MNTKEKGDIALGQAIAYYTFNNIEVFLPIGDKKPYDFIIDRNKLLKIQSKFTSKKTGYGIFVIDLRIKGGNRSCSTVKYYKMNDFDFLFAYTIDGDKYEIPMNCIKEKQNILNLGKKYEKYKL